MIQQSKNKLLKRLINNSIFQGMVPGVLLVAALFQLSISINHDVAYLLVMAKNLVHGQTLYSDIVLLNPPLIIYLYSLPVLLSDISSLTLATSFSLFMTLFIASIAMFVYKLIVLNKHISCAVVQVLLLACLLPIAFIGSEYGQREHFIAMLFIPYILCMWNYHEPISFSNRVLAALCGAVAVAIKPQYIVMLLVCEVFFAIQNRTIRLLFRLETIVLALSGLAYVCFVWFFHREFFTYAIPLAMDFYNQFKGEDRGLVFHVFHVFPFACAAITAGLIRDTLIRQLMVLLLIASIGAYLARLLQSTYWLYHMLPYLIFSVIVFTASIFVIVIERTNIEFESMKKVNLFSVFVGFMIPVLALAFFSGSEFRSNLRNSLLHTSPFYMKDNSFSLVENREMQDALSRLPHVSSVHTFINHINPVFPGVLYGGYSYKSHFPTLAYLTTAITEKNTNKNLAKERKDKIKEFEQTVINLTVNDFIEQSPELVIVSMSEDKNRHVKGVQEIDYLEFFNRDTRFASIWQYYKYHSSVAMSSNGRSFDFYLLDKKMYSN